MHVYILRHGEAAWSIPDHARELTKSGRENTQLVAQQLNQTAVSLDMMIVSPYVRAQQTAEIVLQSQAGTPALRTSNAIVPEGNPGEVMEMLAEIDVDRVMLVSHQPLVSQLIHLMSSGAPNGKAAPNGMASDIPPMLTSSLAYLTLSQCVPGYADLHWIKSPPDFIELKRL